MTASSGKLSQKSPLLLGVRVNPLRMADALEQIQGWVADRSPAYICCVPAHALMDCWDQPALRPIYNQSGLSTPDGMAVVWLLRQRGFQQVERVYGPDLLLAACQHGLEPGWRHYFYGGAPGVAAELAARLSARWPALQIAGLESPPYRELAEDEENALAERIRASRADILWVGLGSPRQERWMHAHLNRLDVPVMVGVGAAFDFLSGRKPQAPRWVQRAGLEWFFRLLSEPRRLWKRYILGYPRFIGLLIVNALSGGRLDHPDHTPKP